MRNSTAQRRVLVVGNKAIGDAVEALPVFELIRRHWPSASVAAGFFKPTQRIAFGRSEYIDGFVQVHGSVKDPLRALRALKANVRAMRGFTDVLVLYKDQAVAWPLVAGARLAGARPLYRHGYASRGRRTTYSDCPEHVVFQIATSELLLGLPLARPLPLSWRVQADEARFAEAFLRKHHLGQRPLVMLNTRGLDRRNWGAEQFARVARELVGHGVDVIVNSGTPEQVDEYHQVATELPRVRVSSGDGLAEFTTRLSVAHRWSYECKRVLRRTNLWQPLKRLRKRGRRLARGARHLLLVPRRAAGWR